MVFAAIISRDDGEPWGSTGMSSQKWLDVPVLSVRIGSLVATQPGVYLHAIINKTIPFGGDQYPHVIHWNNTMYLEDGHHRVIRAALKGYKRIGARVLYIGES